MHHVTKFIISCFSGPEGDYCDDGARFGLKLWDMSTMGAFAALHLDVPKADVPMITAALCSAILREDTSARAVNKARLLVAMIMEFGIAEEVFQTFRTNEEWMAHISARGDEDHIKTIMEELRALNVKVPDLLAEAQERYPRRAVA